MNVWGWGAGPVPGGESPPVKPAKCSTGRGVRADYAARTVPSALHVEEKGGRTAALDQTLALLRDLASLLAVLAADRERQRAKAALRDFLAALEAVTEGALFEAAKRFLDLREGLRFHLNQRELDVVLNIRFGRLSRVEHPVSRAVGALAADVPNLVLHRTHDLAAALFQNPPQFRVPFPLHLPARRFIDAHDESAPSVSAGPPVIVASLYAMDLPAKNSVNLHQMLCRPEAPAP